MPVGFHIALAMALMVSQLTVQDVARNPHGFQLSESGDYLSATGRWASSTDRPSIEVPRVNSVALECWKERGLCMEYLAKLIQPADDVSGSVDRPTLFSFGNEYRIVEWSASTITARYTPRAADVEIRISLVDETVERSSQETAACSAEGGEPSNVAHWVLE